MKDRIVQFLAAEKLSAAEFADKIGVQRSSISHILNGRNYPSANFIQKMLMNFPLLNSRWLMIGTGEMYLNSHPVEAVDSFEFKEGINESKSNYALDFSANESSIKERTLFSANISDLASINDSTINNGPVEEKSSKSNRFGDTDAHLTATNSSEYLSGPTDIVKPLSSSKNELPQKEIDQILFFYKDKTFTIYRPS